MNPINILVAVDNEETLKGLKSLFKEVGDIKIVAEASSSDETIQKLKHHPSISFILLDINMSMIDGIETINILKNYRPDVKILLLSEHDNELYISKILKLGASGYILKKTGEQELLHAIYAIKGGNNYFSTEVSYILLNKFLHKKESQKDASEKKNLEQLTKREIEILRLIALEKTNQEIADKLFISYRTVETHRRNLLKKLDVRNTAGLVKYALHIELL